MVLILGDVISSAYWADYVQRRLSSHPKMRAASDVIVGLGSVRKDRSKAH